MEFRGIVFAHDGHDRSGVGLAMRIQHSILCIAVVFSLLSSLSARADESTYSPEEITAKAVGFFGDATEGLAKAIEKVFEDMGRPNAFIVGEEATGAIGIGIRYGKGALNRKTATPRKVYWQGPSIGWDVGGNASKVFTLIYGLENDDQLFQRFPSAGGNFYYILGVGVSYQQSDDVILARIRTGVGLRIGANVGYVHYGTEHSWLPF
jgi:hypothetical protein